jgi:hypothetical protein
VFKYDDFELWSYIEEERGTDQGERQATECRGKERWSREQRQRDCRGSVASPGRGLYLAKRRESALRRS